MFQSGKTDLKLTFVFSVERYFSVVRPFKQLRNRYLFNNTLSQFFAPPSRSPCPRLEIRLNIFALLFGLLNFRQVFKVFALFLGARLPRDPLLLPLHPPQLFHADHPAQVRIDQNKTWDLLPGAFPCQGAVDAFRLSLKLNYCTGTRQNQTWYKISQKCPRMFQNSMTKPFWKWSFALRVLIFAIQGLTKEQIDMARDFDLVLNITSLPEGGHTMKNFHILLFSLL